MITGLSQSILQTLSYFDIFDYPLTREEIYRFLWQPKENLTYTEFLKDFEIAFTGSLNGKVETKGGYYFFLGKSESIAKRERKILYTEEKLAIAKRGIQKLRYLPFVRAVFVCNQLPVGVKKGSDIDVFIVIKRGRMWITRALITGLLSFFLLRRTNRSIADLLCLSFYVTDDNLDLSQICINAPDIYQAYWIDQLIPVYDKNDFHKKLREKNVWVQSYLPHALTPYPILDRWKVKDNKLSQGIKNFFEWMLGGFVGFFIEKQIRFLQLQKMKFHDKIIRPTLNKNVVISDTMLKFHENDRKEYFKEEWKKRFKVFI